MEAPYVDNRIGVNSILFSIIHFFVVKVENLKSLYNLMIDAIFMMSKGKPLDRTPKGVHPRREIVSLFFILAI